VALTAVGLVLLHAGEASPRFPDGLGPSADLVRAEVVAREVAPCPPGAPPDGACLRATVRPRTGPDAGGTIELAVESTRVQPFPASGDVLLSYDPGAPPGEAYAFADVERRRPLLLLAALFAVVVVALGRWTGLRALLGLGLSLLVVTGFVLPGLLAGQDALLVALVGSAAVMLTVLPLAHGLRVQTAIALLGTLASLVLTVVLAQVFVGLTALTGLGSDETGLISATVGEVDLRGLLLAGIVIGSLGVLDDVTVTQASAVWELHQADPSASAGTLYRSGLRIGRDHIASTVNTLVLAYVGASLPLLVVYVLAGSSLPDVLTSEVVAQEVVRTLVGSIGLVAAVPVTTALAALTVRVDRAGEAASPSN
jgi:uncharacterized membrane protein